MRKATLLLVLFLLAANVSFGQTNLLVNGDLETVEPAFWTSSNDGLGGAMCTWDLENGSKSMRSLKVMKPAATAENVGWKSVNNADLYWNNAAAGVLYSLSVTAKTMGINTSPATDDAKIGVKFTFMAGETVLGEQVVYVDQTVDAVDWTEFTGGLLIPEGTEPDGVYISACMGKDATGTVWFDNIGCGSDPWSMGAFNGDIETPKGWMAWASSSDTGFANTVNDSAFSGEWSAKLEENDEKGDEMVFYSAPAPAEPDKWYKISVTVKTENAAENPEYRPSNTVQQRVDDRMNLCFFFHKSDINGWDLTPPGDLYMYFDETVAAKDWTEYSVVVKAPAEEVQGISVRARFNPQTMGTCWYDDFKVEEIEPGTNVIVNGDLETVEPGFWMPNNDGLEGSAVSWDMENGNKSMRSLKVMKPAVTAENVGWKSVNNADLYWNNAAAGVLYSLSVDAKTMGVNINPATDDAKIGVKFTFMNGETVLGEQMVAVDQTADAVDWMTFTGGLLIPEGTEPDGVYISACMGKDATGTVWFDNIGCGSDPWSMGAFNGDIETPKGWMAWASSSDTGFANTVQDEALSGMWSAKLEELDDKGDEMVFYSAPAPAQPGQWYMVGVSVKTMGMNTNPNYIPSNVCMTRVDDWANLCFFFHKTDVNGWDLTPPGDMFMYFNQVDTTSDWMRYRVAIKAPDEEVAGVSVRARFNPQTMGTVYYDDFCVRPFNINETAIQEEIVNLNVKPESYAVLRNYPNPFNPETNMEYTIPENSVVELAIYNMLGQKIRTMINDFRPAGNYRAVWDGSDNFGMSVPSGVYIARMTGNGFSINTKMLLIK